MLVDRDLLKRGELLGLVQNVGTLKTSVHLSLRVGIEMRVLPPTNSKEIRFNEQVTEQLARMARVALN